MYNRKTKVINLYGGPGTGKSTSASRLFAMLKEAGTDTEIITEYVKTWAWEERTPVKYDQFYFFGKQSRREYTLFHKLEFLITDAPVALNGYYAQLYGKPDQANCFAQMIKVYYDMCESDGVEHLHYFLKRVKPYNPNGRFQNEEEARAIDVDMEKYLTNLGFNFKEIPASKEGVEELFELLMEERTHGVLA